MNELLKKFSRQFLAATVKVESWKHIENYLEELFKREIHDKAALHKWLLDLSELISVVYEEGTTREVAMTCHTDDEELKNRHFDFVENIDSPFKEAVFKLYQKFLAHPLSAQLGVESQQLILMIKTEVELFSEKNIPLEVSEAKLCQHYQEITGSWMVSFEDKEYTMPEMAVFLESNNAKLRENAFKAMASRRIQDQDQLNTLFSNLLVLREQIAANVGLNGYRDYLFKQN
ncbi:MAG: Oligoendopeptidase, M3 family, partial [uncultured bacterium]